MKETIDRRPPQSRAAIHAVAFGLLALSFFASALSAQAQDANPAPPPVASIEQRVDAFIKRLEARRKEQGVVGAAIVVAQGDRIVRSAGFGVRGLDSREAVTEDTVFALGSVTKQFTAMAVALMVSNGKMTFEDHPRRFVPSFRLQDPEANAGLNMIDLLAHRSGLDRSDVTWLLAPFTQDELFELAFRSRPAAKLRERFLYNNAMYALAGAAVASAQQTSYERFVEEQLLKPLGMSSTTVTLDGLTAASNRAVGYGLTKGVEFTPEKPVDLTSVAPAGAINSTARDMGQWLKFLNSGGQVNGTAKIAPAVFARIFESHVALGADHSYGLGFFLRNRSGVVVAEHAGNVPGYTAQVLHVPGRALSFALLTNQNGSRLGAIAQELFWEVVVRPEVAPAAAPPAGKAPKQAEKKPKAVVAPIARELLPGRYFSSQGAEFEVKAAGDDLIAVFARQPPYPLKATATNTYELSGLKGFSVVFSESRAMPGRILALLRQPPPMPTNLSFMKRDDVWLARASEKYEGPDKELIGLYRSNDHTLMMEIVPLRKRVALVLTGQPPYLLKNTGTDQYQLEGLPFVAQLEFKRTGGGRIAGYILTQPNVRLEMVAVTAPAGGDSEVARNILDKAVAAAGGAAALDGMTSIRGYGRTSAPTHGLDGRAEFHIGLGSRADLVELGAFGKTVLKVSDAANERRALFVSYDGTEINFTGKSFQATRFFAVPYALYRWRERFPSVAMAGEATVNGEDAFVIELTAKDLAPMRLYISTKSFMLLRQEAPVYLGDDLLTAPQASDYSDYRVVDGVQIPFTLATEIPVFGRIVMTFDRVELNGAIDPKFFDEPPK